MKTVNTKVYNEKLNRSTKHKDIKNIDYNIIDDSSTTSLPTSKKTVFFVGDSMEKNLNGFYITKRNKHKYLTKARSFSSAKTRCMFDQRLKKLILSISLFILVLTGGKPPAR